MSDTQSILESIGISSKEIPKLLKNKKVTDKIVSLVSLFPENSNKSTTGALIIKLSGSDFPGQERIAPLIGSGKITTMEQLTSAIEFVQSQKSGNFTDSDLEREAGVGITVTPADITAGVQKCLSDNIELIAQKGKKACLGEVMKRVRTATPLMKFAPSKDVASAVKSAIDALSDDDLKKLAEEQKKKQQSEEEPQTFKGVVANFKTPADNAMNNPEDIQKEHMEITGGCFMTRFPPEPNGWIHIGHAKAMLLDFGLAEVKGGKCYMRFDDTNPAKEKDEFIEGIEKDVKWMGFEWWKVTHTSDYFHKLYEFALQLIDNGLAYVCHQTREEIAEYRDKLLPSPWRDRDPKESRREFELMRLGYYEPSEATLRLKMDYKNVNPNMRDQIAYRIIYKPHPRTNDEWCIYPTYDYSHCVIDSIEHVTHSLCTLEFENRRDSYYWVLDALRIYKPIVWEFNRLNLTHTVMSKRRLQTLVYGGYVNGWDDPRMPTIAGMRRRGFTPKAIRDFVLDVGYTRNVTSIIKVNKLEQVQKADLDENSPRAFCVREPLKVTLQNLKAPVSVKAARFPKKPELGDREMQLTSTLYIERSDFMENPDDYFKRLTPKNCVGLKYANVVIKLAKVIKNDKGEIAELICDVCEEPASMYIHWVSEGAVECELRLYGDLFDAVDVSEVEGDWIEALNKNSLQIVKGALIEPSIKDAKEQDRFQFEREGYYVVDFDSKPGSLVFNRTFTLQQRPEEFTKAELARKGGK